ncbi:2,3,4,5-tetrahydropyridine-2,6-carboxylate N-succinyltransferase [Stenotrophomonas koreensis]|uniref:2,3,4,5-tetrahydropyridine-2,6-dicarboxylate N-succinyltransferase n=1 Tax=Stenotrophomonas koreensis TaxID=266128 RepID=A0A0R0BP18_9GAMM|nr:2,3,4,5-tetrahydropyridine-2,6-carboxylate N-succinyltransferase [Stenotrophomonas koreensis]
MKTPAAARPAVTAAPARPAPRKASGKTAVATKAIANKPAGKKAAASKPQAVAKPVVAKESVAKKAVTRNPVGVKTSAAKARKPVAKPAAGKAVPARRAAARPARVPVAKAAPRNTAARKLAAQFNALSVEQLKARIEVVFDARAALTAAQIKAEVAPLVKRVVTGLESGEFRVAQPLDEGGWQVNEWLKKAVLLYFRINDMVVTTASPAPYWDKVEARFAGYDAAKFREAGVRVVPGAVARRGTYFGRDVVLMPSFTNIGAYVGEGTMVDTWATVGSCAQIGKHCHLSGGAGIGGVLEPLQASPTIIEDHCFIGARSEVVEGVIVGHHSVIGMGVFLSQSTRIYNRATGEISYGYIPPYSVVVSGSLPSKDGSHSLYCAVIVKQVDEKTIGKTSINELLRGLAD